MSKNNTPALVKEPYSKTVFENQDQLDHFMKCCDPVTGPMYFMDNFFMIQHPTKGSINYRPWDFQRRLIHTYHNYRNSISLMPRQTGKSTSAAGYLLWYAMFVPDSTILIAAHKYAGAQEIMHRIRYAYENCPDYIKAGCTTYNKGSIDFDNGSRIVSATTTENTGRGMSITLLYIDEFAFVRPSIATEFWTSITPTLSTGGKCIITSTPNSDEDQFALIWKGANKTVDEFGNTTELGINGFKAYRAYWYEHPERDETYEKEMRAKLGDDRFRREVLCFAGDTKVTLRDKTGKVFDVTIEELAKILKTEKKIDSLREEEFLKNILGLKILTDTGWQTFEGILEKGIAPTLEITVGDEKLKVTPDHEIYDDNFNKIPACQLNVGQLVTTVDGLLPVKKISDGKKTIVYDIVNVGENKRFYANRVLASNCEFLIADETLINPSTLIELEGIEPVSRMGQVRWYRDIRKGSIYTVALDPSLGTGGDPAAIQIYDAGTTEQIGEWTHNKTDIPNQIKLLAEICKHINEQTQEPNNIYYSIENNGIGEAAIVSLNEYSESNIPGIFLSEPGKGRKGFNTTNKPKLRACAKLKTLIESKKMKVYSKALISELKTFVANSTNSYSAKVGETDDLVMATILSVRMMTQLADYHGELEARIRDHDEIIQPLPFFAVLN